VRLVASLKLAPRCHRQWLAAYQRQNQLDLGYGTVREFVQLLFNCEQPVNRDFVRSGPILGSLYGQAKDSSRRIAARPWMLCHPERPRYEWRPGGRRRSQGAQYDVQAEPVCLREDRFHTANGVRLHFRVSLVPGWVLSSVVANVFLCDVAKNLHWDRRPSRQKRCLCRVASPRVRRVLAAPPGLLPYRSFCLFSEASYGSLRTTAIPPGPGWAREIPDIVIK
jgi:hypothetical protein